MKYCSYGSGLRRQPSTVRPAVSDRPAQAFRTNVLEAIGFNESGKAPPLSPECWKFDLAQCARLQGFPEAFELAACDNAGRFYHQVGNAVSPPVVAAVAHALLEVLEQADRELLRGADAKELSPPAATVVAAPMELELDEGGADPSRDNATLPVEVRELLRAACPQRSQQRLEDCLRAADADAAAACD